MPRYDMVDTSNNNGTMYVSDFNSMKKRGVKAMVAKLSEGTYFVDQTAKASIANARKAGLHVNGYHFARFTSVNGAIAEARMAARCALAAGLGKDSVIVCDYESNNLGWTANARNIKAWVNEVHRMGYPKTDVYTMGSWINSVPLNNSARGGWVANYPYDATGKNYYGSYMGWQWTSTAHFAGVTGGIDVSQMYSDYYYGSKATKPKPKKPVYFQFNPKIVYTLTTIGRYKNAALSKAKKVDTLPAGTTIEVAELVKYGTTTRFKLANGLYISANKEFINNLYYVANTKNPVKRVKSVKGSHRYTDKNLKHVKDWVKAGTEFDVAKVVAVGSVSRLQLANGLYISGNKQINKFMK